MWLFWPLALLSSCCFLEFSDFIVHELPRANLNGPIVFNYNCSRLQLNSGHSIKRFLLLYELCQGILLGSASWSYLHPLLSVILFIFIYSSLVPWIQILLSPVLILWPSHALLPTLSVYLLDTVVSHGDIWTWNETCSVLFTSFGEVPRQFWCGKN